MLSLPLSRKRYQQIMQELYVETPQQLEQLCRLLEGSEWLTLDTEFVREKSYYPQFCLLQVANGEVAACVDPLGLEDLEPLKSLIYAPSMVKVFHAGRQDLEIFHHLWNELPTPLFDTQLAATLLGLGDQVGYANLVQKVLDQPLEKGHARTDWSRRPLEQAQLRYALDDVIYLGPLYLELKSRLEKLGRETWLKEDFDLLADPSTYTVDPLDSWNRIKGRQYLKGVQLAVLQQLTAWRETEARKSDKPKRWILKDEVLVDLSKRQPKNLSQLERIRGLEPGTIKRRGETLLALIAQAGKIPREDWPREKSTPPKPSPNQEALADLMMCALRLQASESGITHSALASRKDLERLIQGDRELDLVHGWRGALAGHTLVDVLEGRRQIRIVDGRVSID